MTIQSHERAVEHLQALGERPRPVHSRDQIRQRAVERLMILDTPPEERFDRITHLAQGVFDVPISTVTLLDGDRAWFKSCVGMDATGAPRSQTFCDTTVRQESLLVVEDARADPRFADLPVVAGDPGIRFYAGYPLADGEGVVVGTLCLFDTRPRALDERQRALLAELAGWVRRELLDSAEMGRARTVQQQLLPKQAPQFDGYDVAALCIPAQTVGGDFYDYNRFGDGFGFCVADVMGKGTGAAIITATVRAVMRAAAHRVAANRHPDAVLTAATVLTGTNRAMQRDLEETGALVTAFTAYIDGPSGTVHYADAGHGLTVVVGADGGVQWLESLDLPLGVDASAIWSEQQIVLRPGDTLLCFSDGLLDLLGGSRDALDEIADLVRVHPDPEELTAHIRSLTAWGTPTDDVTALALRRRPTA